MPYQDVIVIPTYNEKENIKSIVAEIVALHPKILIHIVDDNSPDGTGNAVRGLMRRHKTVSILSRAKKTGLGDAYKDALAKLSLDRSVRNIITMDADGSHRPEAISALLEAVEEFDLAVGSRYVRGNGRGIASWGLWRRFLSRGGNMYSRILTGVPVRDLTSGFICIKREAVARMDFSRISSGGYAYQIEFKVRAIRHAGATFKEVPITFYERRSGSSKISACIIAEGVLTPLRLFAENIKKIILGS